MAKQKQDKHVEKLDQNKSENYEKMILQVLEDPEDVFEFLCALANAKSRLENKVAGDVFKLSIESIINKSK
jgi:hypothetical protein